MAETSPGDVRATERLHEYWVHGEGAAKIRWGEPNDFARCVVELGKHIKDPQGYCNLAHHAATGMWPAQHAAMEKKSTGRSSVTVTQRAEMATASVNDLPDSDFAYIEPGGSKDGSGKTTPRNLRHFPIHDADHVRNALSRAPQSPFGDKAMPKIRAAAKRLGVDVADSGRSRNPFRDINELNRDFPVEDMHIISRADGDGSGRVVEAFAAVFDQPTGIQDHEGKYTEIIDRSAFNKRLTDLERSPRGLSSVKVLWNHGMAADGTPSYEGSKPVGTPVHIEVTSRGLLTRTEYNKTAQAEDVLELIRSGSVTSQSFTGRIVRSDPQLSHRGARYGPGRDGSLPLVRRMELGLREYGPVLYAAYEGAAILGVRMSTPGSTWEPDEEITGTSPDEEAAAGEPPASLEGDEHSARYHQHALYRLRSQELREQRGLVW